MHNKYFLIIAKSTFRTLPPPTVTSVPTVTAKSFVHPELFMHSGNIFNQLDFLKTWRLHFFELDTSSL